MIHLNYFLDSSDKGREDPEGLSEMEQLIQLSYPKAYEISHQIYQTIAEQTGAKISPNEKSLFSLAYSTSIIKFSKGIIRRNQHE